MCDRCVMCVATKTCYDARWECLRPILVLKRVRSAIPTYYVRKPLKIHECDSVIVMAEKLFTPIIALMIDAAF